MIKRASSILLTLFLLLTSAQVWAENMTSSTTFQKNDDVSGDHYELSDIKIEPPFIEEISTAYKFANTASGVQNTYTVTSGGAEFGYKKKQPQNTFINISLANLAAGTYTATITLKTTGSGDAQIGTNLTSFTCTGGAKKDGDKYIKFEKTNSVGTITYTFTAPSSGKSSISLFWNWDEKEDLKSIIISSITVSGQVNPGIVASKNGVVCKGESVTYTALALGNSVTWTYIENGKTKTHNGTTLTFCPTEDSQVITAKGTSTKTYEIKTEVCCAKDADRSVVAVETFRMEASKEIASVEDLGRGVTTDYKYANSKKPNEYPKEQYVIFKTTDGSWDNWYNKGAVLGHTQVNDYEFMTNELLREHGQEFGKNAKYDGFMALNCNLSVYPNPGSILFKYELQQEVCPNTTHDFSAFISNLDLPSDHYGVNIAFEVEDGNGKKILERKETGDIPCGNQSWNEYGGTFKTREDNIGSQYLTLYVYNNNTEAEADYDHKVVGNDAGIDDIVFSRCVPRIYVSFDQTLKNFSSEECDNFAHSLPIYVGHPNYSVDEILEGAFFIVQQRTDGGDWEAVNIKVGDSYVAMEPTAFGKVDMNELEIEITLNQGETYYRAIVASSAENVKKVMADKQDDLSGCDAIYNITKPDKYAVLTPSCGCTPTEKPKTIGYTGCPTTGTYDLTKGDLITDYNSSLSYVYLDENDVPITSFDLNQTGPRTIYVYTEEYTDASGVVHCESDPAEIPISIGGVNPITFKVNDGSGTEILINEEREESIKICKGTKVSLSSTVVLSAGESFVWTVKNSSGTEDRKVNSINDEVIDEETEFTLSVENTTCWTPLSITVTPIEVLKPNIKEEKASMCLDEDAIINIGDDVENQPTGTQYKWFVKLPNATDYSIIANAGDKDLKNYEPASEGLYNFKSLAFIGDCSVESNIVEVNVGAPIEFKFSNDTTICENKSVILFVEEYPTNADTQWYDEEGVKIIDDVNEEGSPSIVVTPSSTSKYKVEVGIEGGCSADKTVTVTVNGSINTTTKGDEICKGENAVISATDGEKYTWEATNFSVTETTGVINVSPEKTTTYKVTIEKGVCKDEAKVDVVVHDLPIIESVVVEGEKSERTITPNVSNGTEPYSYSLDGEYYSVPEEILKNVPIGWNLLYVKDHFNCEGQKEFFVEPVPIIPDKYFTPNGDGIHDLWTVKNLDAYSSYILEIFDRFGKRLYIKRTGTFNGEEVTNSGSEPFGWDGYYNGHQMPSDDYWYLITVEEIRKQYTGHFTLKR